MFCTFLGLKFLELTTKKETKNSRQEEEKKFDQSFNKLLEDRQNTPFLDVLNHQMALFYDKQEKDKQAISYYKK